MKNQQQDQEIMAQLEAIQAQLTKAEQALKNNVKSIKSPKKIVALVKLFHAYQKEVKVLKGFEWDIKTPTFPYLEKYLAIVKKKQAQKKNTTPSQEEDIDCGTFVSAVSKWHVEMKNFFKKMRTDYAEVVLDRNQFLEHFSDHQSPLPLVESLYQEWQTLLTSLPDTMAGKELFTALLTNSGAAWKMTSNLQAIEQHYKQNKKAYKKYQSTMESFRDEEMPKAKFFLDALQASTSEEDPNLPENVEEAKQEEKEAQKEAERDRKEELERWQIKYETWLNENLEALNEIDTTEEGQVINKNLLTSYRSTEMLAPPYAQTFWKETGAAIEQAILAEEGTVAYKKASKIAIRILGQKYQEYVTQEFLQAGIKSNDPSSPLGLQDWLKASIENNKGELQKFLSQWQDWCKAASNVVALCENKMMGKTYTIDPNKLEKELTTAFTYTVNGTSPGLDIWKKIQAHLPQGKASFDQLLPAWQDGISALLEEEFAKSLWSQHLTGGQGNENLEQAIAQFFAKAPSPEKLVNALWDARYHSPKASTPQQKEPLRAAFKAERSNGQQGFHFFVHIPLEFQKAPNQEGKTWQHALPSAQTDHYYIEVADSLSYEIDKASLRIERHNPNYTVKNNFFSATTGVTFYLHVRDTLSRRVVDKGGKGKFNLLTVDADLKDILLPQLKKLNIDTGFFKVGGSIDLVGDGEGEMSEIKTQITLMGFPVTVHYYPNKEWPANIKMESTGLLAYRKATMMDTYGSQSYDIKFYAEVYSVREGSQQEVSVINGRSGSVTLDERGEESGREDLKVQFVGGQEHKILLINKD